MSLSPQFLNEIRARTTLSALIGRSIKIEKAGREYKACCPFHNEKTPSFTISDEKEFYHCHGCGAHGDAIRWLTQRQGLGFIEAVRELAEAAGLSMPERSAEAAKRSEWINGLRPVLDAAQALYASNLSTAPDIAAYLAGRGVDARLIADFGLGFAPKSGCLRGQNFGIKSALAAGLLGEAEAKPGEKHGATYERFRNRIMIPIHDGQGRMIGFGGRISPHEPATDDRHIAKYVNSPGSELFDKGRTLFNLHRARPAAVAAKRVIAVEGYMDVIAMASINIGEAVAPMGTAITPAQLELLWRMHHRPVLLFDGDVAGQKAAVKACETALPFVGPGKELAIAVLPAGIDPDDMINKADSRDAAREAVEGILAAAKGCHEYLFDAVVNGQAGAM